MAAGFQRGKSREATETAKYNRLWDFPTMRQPPGPSAHASASRRASRSAGAVRAPGHRLLRRLRAADLRSTERERNPPGGGPMATEVAAAEGTAGRRSGFWPQLAVSRGSEVRRELRVARRMELERRRTRIGNDERPEQQMACGHRARRRARLRSADPEPHALPDHQRRRSRQSHAQEVLPRLARRP